MGNAAHFSGETFEQDVLNSDVPVLVDFWAEWCGPCRMIAADIDALALEYAGKAKVGKVDVDAEQDLANKYGISSIPALLFFKDGKLVDQLLGRYPKRELATRLDSLL